MEKRRRTELTMEEEFELIIGPHGEGQSVFPPEEARRAAWEAHREELLAEQLGCWGARRYDGALEDDEEDNEPAPDPDAAGWRGYESDPRAHLRGRALPRARQLRRSVRRGDALAVDRKRTFDVHYPARCRIPARRCRENALTDGEFGPHLVAAFGLLPQRRMDS